MVCEERRQERERAGMREVGLACQAENRRINIINL